MSSLSSPNFAAIGAKSRRQARPSSPSPSAVSSTERSITPALPSSSGCARSTSGQRHSSPCFSSPSELRNGEPTAIGCTAEQWSWRTPGTVSSLVRVPPPISSAASSTVTAHALARERGRGREAVRPGADDDRVAQAVTAGSAGRRLSVTSTGNSHDSSSHGRRSTMSATLTQPSSIRPVAAS